MAVYDDVKVNPSQPPPVEEFTVRIRMQTEEVLKDEPDLWGRQLAVLNEMDEQAQKWKQAQ